MRRAALLLYDPTYRAVIPMGSYGVDASLFARVEGTLDETPIAREALEQDCVVVVSGGLEGHVPARYAQLADTEAITCTPIAAARRWLGVIFADREGELIDLDDGERETMLTLGRLAALAPLGWRVDDPTPVADAACFLLSDLSRATSGEILHVDGGAHAIGGVPSSLRPASLVS